MEKHKSVRAVTGRLLGLLPRFVKLYLEIKTFESIHGPWSAGSELLPLNPYVRSPDILLLY